MVQKGMKQWRTGDILYFSYVQGFNAFCTASNSIKVGSDTIIAQLSSKDNDLHLYGNLCLDSWDYSAFLFECLTRLVDL